MSYETRPNTYDLCPVCGNVKRDKSERCRGCRAPITQPSDPAIRVIPLTKGYEATVSACQYDRVALGTWTADVVLRKDGTVKTIYAVRGIRIGDKWTSQRLHRFILGVTDPKIKVDHWDGDGLNCQDHNLRLATNSQNLANRGMNCNNTSGFKGVVWNASERKWKAQIKIGGKGIGLGSYASKLSAAEAYNLAAVRLFGEFAKPTALDGEIPNWAGKYRGEK